MRISANMRQPLECRLGRGTTKGEINHLKPVLALDECGPADNVRIVQTSRDGITDQIHGVIGMWGEAGRKIVAQLPKDGGASNDCRRGDENPAPAKRNDGGTDEDPCEVELGRERC